MCIYVYTTKWIVVTCYKTDIDSKNNNNDDDNVSRLGIITNITF